MTGRTILAYFTNEERADRLAEVAKTLAGVGGDGRLLGLYAGAQYVAYPSYGEAIPPGFYEAHCGYYATQASSIEARFNAATEGGTLGAEWRYLPPTAETEAERVTPVARACDLVVTDLLTAERDESPFYGVAESIALSAGRPVLLLPDAPASKLVGGRILLAWDGGRESARAAFDALPLLAAAGGVNIACVREPDAPGKDELPAADIAATLAHHGVECAIDHVSPENETVGAALSRHASAIGADLIVMGAYGHSRLREFVFGGATRHLLRTSTTPLFVSH